MGDTDKKALERAQDQALNKIFNRQAEIDARPGQLLCYEGQEPPVYVKGTKFDQGKPSLSLIPRVAQELEAQVFGFGAKKYGRDNYKQGMDWLRITDAALRHITAFADGEDIDPESGLPHLAHARCCMAMLLFYSHYNVGTDDRYKHETKEV